MTDLSSRQGVAGALLCGVLLMGGCLGPADDAWTGTTTPPTAGRDTSPETTAPDPGQTNADDPLTPSTETISAIVATVLVGDLRAELTLSVGGDWRVDAPADGVHAAFDARQRSLHLEDGGGRVAHVGLAPSGPDSPRRLIDTYLPLALVSRALDKASEGATRPGRWHDAATLDFSDHFRRPGLEEGAFGDDLTDHVWASVDEESLLPLYVTHAADQRPRDVAVSRWEVESFAVVEVERLRFRLWEPDGESTVIDHGFTRVDAPDAPPVLGYRPPEPGWLPAGYLAADLVVAEAPLLWWSYPSNPPSEAVAVLTYRRGAVETLTVTTRRGDTGRWGDPYHRGDTASNGDLHRAPSGAFLVVHGPWPFWPVTHAWGEIGGIVVTVGGDVSPDELRMILDHLEFP